MLFFVLMVLFRVKPPNELTKYAISNSRILSDFDKCLDVTNGKYSSPNFESYFVKCDGTSTENAIIRLIRVNTTNYITKNGDYVYWAESAEIFFQECNFLNGRCKTAMIYCTKKDITIYSSLISNCYYIASSQSTSCLIKSRADQGRHTDFQNNTITFANHDNSCRVFDIKYSTNCIMKNNTITRASVTISGKHSICLFETADSADEPLIFQDNVIDDCLGGNSALINIANIEYHLKFIRTTFKNMRNHYNYEDGYYMTIATKSTVEKPLLSFIECTFYHFESNAKCGNVLGLWYKCGVGNNNMALIVTDCTFENIHYSNGDKNGGAVGMNSRTTITNTHITVTGTTFKNVSSLCGGSAICFIVNSAKLIVEKNTFIDCKSTNNNCNGGAILIEFKTAMPEVVIKDCSFQSAVSNNPSRGNAITAIQSSGTKKLTIENCDFLNCGVNGFAAYISLNDFVVTGSSISFTKNTNGQSCGGFDILNCVNCQIDHIQFVNTNTYPSLSFVQKAGNQPTFKVNYCTFDGWSGSTRKCFEISLGGLTFSFDHNIVKNMIGTGPNNYFGSINCNFWISALELTNITFNDNQCKSLYGGGIGLLIERLDELSFVDCKFINNVALQDTTESRSTDYYNGDGGGFQFGYSSATNSLNILFQNCQFRQNHAFRHGGALAIQSLERIDILNCVFEENEANSPSSSSFNLLFEDHFNKKMKGRGGAIYINPTYQLSNEDYMKQINIIGCTFTSNKAFDGFAIYIEGEERINTIFAINNNNFINNYHPDYNSIDKSVVTSEVLSLDRTMVLANTFSFNDDIHVSKFLYVDHYGIPPAPTGTPFPIPEDAPIPISIKASQFTSNGDKECSTPVTCPAETESDSPCGEQCKLSGTNQVYEYTFMGEGFQVFGSYGPNYHEYSIYLDDTFLASVDQHQLSETNYVLQFTSRILSYELHKVKIVGNGQAFVIYKLAYWPSISAKRINITDFEKTGTWNNEADGIGGIAQYTDDTGNVAKKTIFASKFWIFGTKFSNPHKMNVLFGDLSEEVSLNNEGDRVDMAQLYESVYVPLGSNELKFTAAEGTMYLNCIFYLDVIPPSPVATLSMSPLPTQYQYNGDVFENIANGKNNYMQFNCPIIEGNIRIYSVCKKCDKIGPAQKVWFEVFFKDGNLERINHQDIVINGNTKLSVFISSNKISYDQDSGILSYYIDSVNMYYVDQEIHNLKCYVAPMTPKPTVTQSPEPTPRTDPNFINNTFVGSVGVEQVQAGNNNINEISGCNFTNIHDTQRNYYIKINKEIDIFNNIFENTEFISSDVLRAGIFFSAFNGRITLTNCKFIQQN